MSVVAVQQNLIKDLSQLFKLRLNLLVLFSSAMVYLMAVQGSLDVVKFSIFLLAGFLVTGCANTLNQIFERDLDQFMKRTCDRPLPSGRMLVSTATSVAILSGVAGLVLMAYATNLLTVALSFASIVLYAFFYTPLKTKSPLAVVVGAIPGAMPPLIGWVAYSGSISYEPIILFSIQFIWQFPHFWAIAWVLDEDYQKAGIKLLPSGGRKDFNTAFQIMIYTLLLLPLGLLPLHMGFAGVNSAVIATLCGTLFLIQTFQHMRVGTDKSALRIMFGSFLYLPIVQIAFLLDKV
jgi:protoheme IX farnesyltransferase